MPLPLLWMKWETPRRSGNTGKPCSNILKENRAMLRIGYRAARVEIRTS